jgi:hypothetical protein
MGSDRQGFLQLTSRSFKCKSLQKYFGICEITNKEKPTENNSTDFVRKIEHEVDQKGSGSFRCHSNTL